MQYGMERNPVRFVFVFTSFMFSSYSLKVTEDLKVRLSKLKAVIEKPTIKEDSPFDKHDHQLSQRIEQPCIVFMSKQFERILVKYVALFRMLERCDDRLTVNIYT